MARPERRAGQSRHTPAAWRAFAIPGSDSLVPSLLLVVRSGHRIIDWQGHFSCRGSGHGVPAYCIKRRASAGSPSAETVTVEIEADDHVLRVRIGDDGGGGAEFGRGSGLVGLRDWVEALGGRISLQSTLGLVTSTTVELPLPEGQAAVADR